jgi:uncharacterized LabA/DUF88 family protein
MPNSDFESSLYFLDDVEKTALLIDGPSTYKVARQLDINVDYGKLLELFQSHTHVIKTYFFTSKDTRRAENSVDDLLHWLSLNGYITCVTEYDRGDDGERREGIEVDFTIKALNVANDVDHLILFTGAGKFVPLVKYLDGMNKKITICSSLNPNGEVRFVSLALRKAADNFIDLHDIRDHIQMDRVRFNDQG